MEKNTVHRAVQPSLLCLAGALFLVNPCRADAPGWMRNLVSAPVPAHDEKTDAAVMYSEKIVTVQSADKIKILVRKAYKILRPDGRDHGLVLVSFNSHSKVTSLHGWCIPAQGKDYEVKDRDAMEVSIPKITGSELISDTKDKVLQIPAADPGNIVGFEYEKEEQPMVLQEEWDFQEADPVRESRFTLQLPASWEYKTYWLNSTGSKETASGSNQWQWVMNDLKGLRTEEQMPPWDGVAGELIVNFYPSGGAVSDKTFQDWRQMGTWYLGLTRGRRDLSPEIKQKVAALTADKPALQGKILSIARFMQTDIRYVAIELGIGGVQPHSAIEVFLHRYGDCKDKATLMSAMLQEIGVDSYYVLINTERGGVTESTPAQVGAFDHAILAVKLPDGMSNASFVSAFQHPKLGKLLFFDPTNSLVPFGEIGGYLQANYGLLATPDGGELIPLPKQPAGTNGVDRKGMLKLDARGNLQGSFTETRRGDRAWSEREAIRTTVQDKDRAKRVESLLSASLANFALTKLSFINLEQISQPFGYEYSFIAERYAKTAGNLLIVRPRVIGVRSSGLLETKEPRHFPVIFEGPERDTDTVEIEMPAGYEVDDLPLPVDLDYSFASYHSKTEANGNVLKYTRSFEIKELDVPMNKMEELKKFYRVIASDEQNTAVLKPKS